MSIQKTIKVDSRRPNLNARFFEQGLPKSAVLLSFKEFDKLIRKSITRFPGEVSLDLAKEVAYQEPPCHFQDTAHALFHEKVWGELEVLRLKLRESLLKTQEAQKGDTPQDIKSLTELWLEDVEVSRKSSGTRASRQTAVNHILGYLPRKATVSDIDPDSFDSGFVKYLSAYRSKRTGEKLADSTLHQVHKQVHQLLKWARKKKVLGFVEKEKVSAPKPRSIALERDEVKKVLKAIEDDNTFSHAAFSTGAVRNIRRSVKFLRYTGVRRSELFNLRLSDIHLEGTDRRPFPHCIVLPKGNKAKTGGCGDSRDANNNHQTIRSIGNPTLLAFLKQDLASRSKNEIWFLDNGHGSPQWSSPQGIYRNVANLLKKLGITGVQPCHVFRHTVGIEMTEAGKPISFTQHALGHSTAQTTLNRYQDVGRIQRELGNALAVID